MAPGAVDPDRLPDLYAAADVGIIPYRQYALLVDNGLPLKALEMCATGLPVVTSLMKPLEGIAAGLVVTASPDEFLDAFSKTSRAGLSQADLNELSAVSSANDYDKKFDQIIGALNERIHEARPTTRVDRLIEVLGSEWFASEIRLSDWIAARLMSQVPRRLLKSVMRRVPSPIKRRLDSNRPRGSQRDPVN
jgi:glycosyltransferase involved in cell wall biosynthesis